MRVRHYPRVSSKKQADKGDSIEFQNKRLNEDSNLKKDIIVETHTDAGRSASISDDKIKIWHKDGFIYAKIDIKRRKAMNEILDSLVDPQWDALKITRWDRFSRNNLFSQLMLIYFREHGKEIIAVDDSNDSLVRDILAVLGQEEIKKSKIRVKEARYTRIDRGMFPGRSPFGYKPIYRKKRVIGHKINEEESTVIRNIFKLKLQGKKEREIAKELNLYPTQIKNIVKNKAYAGYVSFQGKEQLGIHPKIISLEVWEKCQDEKE